MYLCDVKKAIFIIVLFMLAKPVIPVLDYIVNYDYIAKELCENKAKPEMHCNGKCHLMKELAKASEGEKQQQEKKNVHQELELLFCEPVASIEFAGVIAVPATKAPSLYNNLYSHQNAVSVFHPPVYIL